MFSDENSSVRIFWILIIGCILSIFISFFNNFLKAGINSFASVLEDVTINVEFNKKNIQNDFLICFNDSCKQPQSDKLEKVFYLKYNPEYFRDDFYSSPLQEITFVFKDADLIENIKNIYLYVGHNSYLYNKDNINNFQKKQLKIKLDNSNRDEVYNALVLPNDFKTNYKGFLNNICALFLFIFYGWKHFLVSYLMLFGAICVYIYNKDKIKILPYLKYIALFFIFSAAIILRYNLLFYNPLWLDELYTKTIALRNFISCFHDAGNPPLYYLIQFFISKIFSNSYITLKLTSFIIGVLFVPCCFIFFRKISFYTALFAAFFASINIINIYQSQEVRSGGLCAILILLSIYFLFNYLRKNNNKNLFLYSLISALTINTHYYLAIFAFCNYIYGIFNLKDKKEKIKFSFLNFLSAITFLPYLLISFNNALNSNFNSWIGTFDSYKFVYAIREFFLNKYIFLFFIALVLFYLIIIFLPEKYKKKLNILIDNDKKQMFLYILFTLVSILFIICIISLTIKPIFHKRLCLSLYSLFFILQILLISTPFRVSDSVKKYKVAALFVSTLTFFICTTITHPMPLNKIYRIDDYIDFINYDSQKYINQNYEIHAVMTDYIDYLYNYPHILNKRIIWHIINVNSGKYIANFRKSDFTNSKKAVIYLNSIGAEFKEGIALKKNSYIIQTNSTANAKVVYDD